MGSPAFVFGGEDPNTGQSWDPNSGGGSGGGGSSFDWASLFRAATTGAQIYTNYQLASRAENAQRPTTFQVGVNGTPVVTGGGAPNLGLTGQNSIFGPNGNLGSLGGSSLLIIVIIVVVLILVLKR